ncbi:MAG: dihydrodipicolinate synthase family protein [Chloroflexi bacterium]|nr:dihydrodipicolinate synthase family protein [Chloroflexota bacterium]
MSQPATHDWRSGVIAGVVTPFGPDGTVDAGSLAAHLRYLAAAGVSGIVVNADTGEGPQLDQQERETVLGIAVKEVGADVAVLVGLIASHTATAVASARRAEAAGAVALQVFPPAVFLGCPLDPGLVAGYYEAIGASVGIPLVAYRPPTTLGYGIDTAVIRRLASIEAVVAIKESSFDVDAYRDTAVALRPYRPRVALLSGADTFVRESLRIGADGLMLAVAAFAPDRWVALARDTGLDPPASDDPYADLSSLAAAVFRPPFRDFRARLKALLVHAGVIADGRVRPPLMPIGQRETTELHRLADHLSSIHRGEQPG